MSRRHVETIVDLYAALETRDLPALTALLDPQAVIRQSGSLPWGGEFHGPDGFTRFFHGVFAALDSELEIERLIDAGDTVVVWGTTRGVVRATGASFEAAFTHVYRLTGDLIVEAAIYVDQQRFVPALKKS